jgi:hypothetical protein
MIMKKEKRLNDEMETRHGFLCIWEIEMGEGESMSLGYLQSQTTMCCDRNGRSPAAE